MSIYNIYNLYIEYIEYIQQKKKDHEFQFLKKKVDKNEMSMTSRVL